MATGPIDWGAHDGDLVERALAVMLLQERPHAWRRIASAGDAGVDVADPQPHGCEVFQIKSFTGGLTDTRKKQIKKSFGRILAGGELTQPVVAWRLLVPMGPTKEMEAWFKKLTKDAPFECEWLGASRVDLLASNNPHVVDYYFRDGKARVEQRYRDLLQARALIESADAGPRPAEVKESLRELLEALNRDDPHYRYAYEASHDAPPTSAEGARPGLVMSATECDGDRGCITIRVFARHRHAVEERPIRIHFGLEAEGAGSLQTALDYGSTTELEDGVVRDLVVDAPGGLDTKSGSAALRVSGHAEEDFVPFRLLLTVRDPDGAEQARTTVAVVERRAGARGKALICREVGGAFEFELRVTDPSLPDATVSLSAWTVTAWGKAPAQVRAGIGLLASMSSPNEFDVSLDSREGPQLMAMLIDEQEPLVPTEVAEFVEDLAEIQQHCAASLVVPDSISVRDVRRAREAAQLVRGTIIDGTWNEGHVTIDAEHVAEHVTTLTAPHAMAVVLPYETEVAGQAIALGDHLVRFASARVADPAAAITSAETASDGQGIAVRIVPGDDDRLERLWPAPASGPDLG